MKKILTLAACSIALFGGDMYAQCTPFVENFESYSVLSLVPQPWRTRNFNVYQRGTGTPATKCAQSTVFAFGRVDSLISPPLGVILPNSAVVYSRRIVQYVAGSPVSTVLQAGDKLDIQATTNNGATYTTLKTITQASPNINFINDTLSLASFVGQTVRIRFVATANGMPNNEFTVHIDNVGLLCNQTTNTKNQPGNTQKTNCWFVASTHSLTIETALSGLAIVRLTDAAGRVAFSKSIALENHLPVSILLPTNLKGIYAASVVLDNQYIVNKKIIIE